MPEGVVERRSAELVRRCHAGLDTATLRAEVLRRLGGIVTVDAAFFATVDPATLLFTSAWSESPLDSAAAQFLANEIGGRDVNRFGDLAAAPLPARTLDAATGGDRSSSARYREIMAALGLGDELRVALRSNGAVWGVLCLHRADGRNGFDAPEVRTIATLAPHLGAALRHSTMLDLAVRGEVRHVVGLVVLDAVTLEVAGVNDARRLWLESLRSPIVDGARDVPLVVEGVARRALTRDADGERTAPMVRCRDRDGTWLVVHASVLEGGESGTQVGVVIEPATAPDLGSFVLQAFGLTTREREVAELVLRGCSTRQIVDELRISAHTTQDHLKSIFTKVGVGSRRELVATLLRR